jgi:hypothetical protein
VKLREFPEKDWQRVLQTTHSTPLHPEKPETKTEVSQSLMQEKRRPRGGKKKSQQ